MDIKITHVIDFAPALLALLAKANNVKIAAPAADAPKAPATTAEAVKTAPEPVKEETKAAAAKGGKGKKGDKAPDDNSDIEDTLEGARVIIKRVAASDGNEGNDGGIDFAKSLLKKYGAEGVGQLDASKYADFVTECKEILATGGFKKHGTPPKKSEAADVFG